MLEKQILFWKNVLYKSDYKIEEKVDADEISEALRRYKLRAEKGEFADFAFLLCRDHYEFYVR